MFPAIYTVGFLLVIGFDKMFNIYIRSSRKRIMPATDFGKTTGLIVMLNKFSQPFADLLVALLAGNEDAGPVILVLSLVMALTGLAVLWFGRRAGFASATSHRRA